MSEETPHSASAIGAQAEEPRHGPRGLRWLRRLGLLALVLGVLLVGAALAIVYTDAGTRVAARVGLSVYNGMIPGSVSVGRVEGSIAEGITLTEIRIEDRNGHPLVLADRLRASLDPIPALGKRLELGEIEVDGAEVFVLTQETGGFGDLAPAGEPGRDVPRVRFGPDLPVEILGRVVAHDSALYLGIPDAPVLWVDAPVLTLQTHGGGLEAWASLEGQARMPTLELDASHIELSATWSEPAAEAVGLRVESNWGTLDLDRIALDLGARTVEVERLAFAPEARWLAQHAGNASPTDATLRLTAAGTPTDLFGEILVEAGEGAVALDLHGAFAGEPELEVWLGGEVSQVPGAAELFASGLFLDSYARASGSTSAGVVAELDAVCAGCALDPIPVAVKLGAVVEPERTAMTLELAVDHGLSRLQALGSAFKGGRRELEILAAIPRMSSFAPLLRALGVAQRIEGSLELRADCEAERSLAAARCATSVAVSEGSPVREARLLATLGADKHGWTATISELFVDALGARVKQTGPPLVARYEDSGQASLRDLEVDIATRTGRGGVTASALVDPGGQLEGSAHLTAVDLAAVRAFVPKLPLAGIVDADLTLAGSLDAPRIGFVADGTGLALGRAEIGALALATSYAHERWKLSAHVKDGHMGRLDVEGDLPLALDLRKGRAELLASKPVSVAIASEAIELTTLTDLAPKLAALQGSVALDARLEGSLRTPTLMVAADLVGASYAEHPLPDVQLDARYGDRALSATVHATHPAVRRVDAEVHIPFDFNLWTTKARWRYAEEHAVTVELDGMRLTELRAWVPEAAVEGIVSVRGTLRGPATAPRAALEVHGRRLRYADRPVGRVDVEARHEEGVLSLAAQTTSPAIGGFGLAGKVPIGLDPKDGSVAWRHADPHEVDLFVSGLVVERLLDWFPSAVDVGGRVDLRVVGSGSAVSPRVEATASVDRLRYGPRRLGAVEASATYADEVVAADARWTMAPGRLIDVRASVPLNVDLPRFHVGLAPHRDHALRLAAPRIDRVMLAPFVELGEMYDSPLAVHLVADGNIQDFLASAALSGVSRTGGRVQPIGGRVVLGPHEQSLSVIVGEPTEPWLEMGAKVSAPLVAVLEGTTPWEQTTVSMNVDVNDVALDFFEALLPPGMRNLKGTVAAHIGASGTLGDPQLSGRLQVRDGAATIVSARTRVRGFGLDMVFDNHKIDISDIHFYSGPGSLTGRGLATFSREDGLKADLELGAKRLPILRPGLPRMEYSGNIRGEASFDGKHARVEVGLGKTLVAVLDLGVKAGKAVDSNEGIVIVDLEEDGANFEEVDPVLAAPTRDGSLVARLVLDDPLRIVGGGVNMTWTGSVGVRHENGSGSVEGSLQAAEGTLALLGNDFELRSGRVTLPASGSLVPFIDAEAVTAVDGVDISAVVRGRVTRPDLVLSSTSALSQSEIFSALVTGSADSAEADSDEVGAKAASLLVAVRSQALQQQVSERLNVDRIGFGFGEDAQQPILTIGKNLTKKLYAETEFHHNAPSDENGAELRLRYRFAPRWSLESFVGDAAASGMGVYWARAFATQRRLRKAEAAAPGETPAP